MNTPNQLPYVVFSGAFGDNGTGGYFPAQAEVSNGFVTLWVASPSGWVQYFSLPATEVGVKSAAQRITLVAHGRSYPILADPRAVGRALDYNMLGTAANILDKPLYGAKADVGRGLNQLSAARSWNTGSGPEFIAAARSAGARVSRLGYGAIAAIGCGSALLVVVAVLVITALMLRP
ncbi:hypothetical protein [Paenarthrobacter sp. JL.01a]|uniref:hypothetical protein n=1 Tax=Paenarthrobacter sp. JL.01a TaxID=2979324 RepID=UPI0021C81846|nr:hypothetical protein [Paenarthrobacter sp. JL.01a]UXM92139.1 hypothetical protein N5P29_02115 [Paenarthrobacter sp. JL.01a]